MKISVQAVLDLLHSIIHPIAPDLVYHLQRTAIISWYVGNRAGFDDTTIRNAYLASMLHDIDMLGKERTPLTFNSDVLLKGNERLAASMMVGIRFLQPAAAILENQYVECSQTRDDKLANAQHLVHFADEFELFLRGVKGDYATQRELIISQFLNSTEPWPACLVAALHDVSTQDGFWFRLSEPSLHQVLHVISPFNELRLEHHDFLEVCLLVSRIVDKYSRFTQTHSTRVAHVAAKLAELYGYGREMQEKVCIAGYLHDIGKLFIPLNILEKCGKLEPDEYAQMKHHSYKTRVMLNPIEELGDIVHWAANHHERLDGSGYPFRLDAASLDIPSRIIAVADVFTAMTENRPYRQGMPVSEALEILQQEALNYRLDQDIVSLLSHNIDAVKALVALS
ncbi:HD domain-containing protein [Serratia fonticola]|uniref:HD domain-containing protein n=1 Tax=Serratia fonticola TaxID=47917 RepID=A0A559T543_SERFO|nr:HD domain-containing phosphohydrolase [Serratia fonticola]TQI77790.1 HD domain-containing protein [Serratia fonticola]TQI95215.1 HD domain-containing protein [Serratia fonticola]TVZ69712.1 HD domain-containing protein [Serratia fonticola]